MERNIILVLQRIEVVMTAGVGEGKANPGQINSRKRISSYDTGLQKLCYELKCSKEGT
jgi:hypothetical protein